jgi:hypothetical protein
MARIREIAMPYIRDYLDPTGEIRNGPNNDNAAQINIKTSPFSKIEQIYTQNKAVTIFYTCSDDEIVNVVSPELCFDARFEDGSGPHHDSYHKNGDYNKPHLHVTKGNNFELNEKDFNCMIETIKSYEKQNQMCKDGKTNCHLSDEDANKIKNAYSQYVKQKGQSILNENAEEIYYDLENKCIAASKSFIQSFLTTFLDKYLKGYLINQGLYHRHASWAMEILKSTITLGLGASYLATANDFIIRNLMGGLLSQLGVNSEIKERMLSAIGTALAYTKDPSSLVEVVMNGSAAAMGQSAAYQVIRALPKLKVEPPIKTNTQELKVAKESAPKNLPEGFWPAASKALHPIKPIK